MGSGRQTLRGRLGVPHRQDECPGTRSQQSLAERAGGNQRVDGAQVRLRGHLTDRWELLSSYASGQRGRELEVLSPADRSAAGERSREYLQFLDDLSSARKRMEVGVGGNFVDKRTASSTVPYCGSHSYLHDGPAEGGARLLGLQRHGHYPLNEQTSLQLNLTTWPTSITTISSIRLTLCPGRASRSGRHQIQILTKEENTLLLPIPEVLTAEQFTQARQLLDSPIGSMAASRPATNPRARKTICSCRRIPRPLASLASWSSRPRAESAVHFRGTAAEVFPPLFNRYQGGQSFGTHVDNAIRQVTGTPHRIRTDLSATLFFTGPDEYDGGELVVEDTYGTHSVKLPAGH